MDATIGLFQHFTRLLDFKGREDRASFWSYAAVVYAIMMVGTFVAMTPMMRLATVAGKENSRKTGGGARFPDMGAFVTWMMIVTAIAVVLYAAAVVRRLHDAGFSGLWGLMPLPFLLFGMIRMRGFFASIPAGHPDMDQFNQIFVNNLIYILTLIALIVLLARRSHPDRNRFDTVA